LLVDDVLHRSKAIEANSEWGLEGALQSGRTQNAALHSHWVVAEEVVHANTKALVSCDTVSDTVSNAVVAVALVYVIGVLGLEEVGRTMITVPLHEISQQVLRCPSHHSDGVTVDARTDLAGIVAVHNALPSGSMIRAPKPEVIAKNIPRVDLQHDVGSNPAENRASHTEEHIVKHARILGAATKA
jgi:hypothetical protein